LGHAIIHNLILKTVTLKASDVILGGRSECIKALCILPISRASGPIPDFARLFPHIISTELGVPMAKRSTRSKSRDHGFSSTQNVHPLFQRSSWSPHQADQESRDRKYVKNVRAMSATQQQLMDAIDEKSVVLALGPAGTGKTYLAIAKAVEALESGKVSRIVLSRPAVKRVNRWASCPVT
jgi:hypothetical protein